MSLRLRDTDHGYKAMTRAASGTRQGRRLRVGVKGDEQVEMVAAVQEFGSDTVPSRSYLRAWFDANRERINDHLRVVAWKSLHGDGTRDELLTALGHQYRDEIQQEILRGLDPELAEATLRQKAAHGDPSTPLVTSAGHLLSSIVAMLDGEIV